MEDTSVFAELYELTVLVHCEFVLVASLLSVVVNALLFSDSVVVAKFSADTAESYSVFAVVYVDLAAVTESKADSTVGLVSVHVFEHVLFIAAVSAKRFSSVVCLVLFVDWASSRARFAGHHSDFFVFTEVSELETEVLTALVELVYKLLMYVESVE